MLIEQIIPETDLEEGPNDPSIYKAIFLAGGPGSGKSFVVRNLGLGALGFKVVNNDSAFEKYLRDAGLESTPSNIFSPQGQEIRLKAKTITNKQMQLYLKGALGLVIDGTGKDYEKIKRQADKLKNLGYDTAMVFVNTDLETALNRNRQRARQLPDEEVDRMWSDVQKNIGKFQTYFGNDMYIVDNSEDSDVMVRIQSLHKKFRTWSKQASNRKRNQVPADIGESTLNERYINAVGFDEAAIATKEKYKDQVWDLLQRSYKSIGGIKGSGFESPEAMVEKIPMWKMGIRDGKVRAVILYKDKGGRKSVAIGTDGSPESMFFIDDIFKNELKRSYGEKSKAALGKMLKIFPREVLEPYIVTPDHVATMLPEDRIIPIKDIKETEWPGDARVTLTRYPYLIDYGYLRPIGGDYVFKVMIGEPGKTIK